MGWAKEGRHDSFLPTGVRFSLVPTKVQAFDVEFLWWKELTEPAYLLLSVPNRNIIDNDVIMTKLFIGTLKGVAFDWFKSLLNGSINFWVELKNSIPLSILWVWHRSDHRQALLHGPERRRVRNGLHKEILQTFTFVSYRHAFVSQEIDV